MAEEFIENESETPKIGISYLRSLGWGFYSSRPEPLDYSGGCNPGSDNNSDELF